MSRGPVMSRPGVSKTREEGSSEEGWAGGQRLAWCWGPGSGALHPPNLGSWASEPPTGSRLTWSHFLWVLASASGTELHPLPVMVSSPLFPLEKCPGRRLGPNICRVRHPQRTFQDRNAAPSG